jgi:RHS repeat-associated protein
MAGISSKALGFGDPGNKYKYNGKEQQNKEFFDGSGLELLDYGARMYDNQIGRFFTQDALSDSFTIFSPYQFAGNEVPNAIDLDGREPLSQHVINARNGTKGWWNDFNAGRGKTYAALDWFNRNINPVGLIVHGTSKVTTGRDLITGEQASRIQGVAEIGTGLMTLFTAGYFKIGLPNTSQASVWELNQSMRGRVIEGMLGGNLPKNFKTFDKFEEGIATSIKSLDLSADGYIKNPKSVLSAVKGYVNEIVNFEGDIVSGVSVQPSDITKKALELAINPSKATKAQWEALADAVKYAKEQNVQFTLQFIK